MAEFVIFFIMAAVALVAAIGMVLGAQPGALRAARSSPC